MTACPLDSGKQSNYRYVSHRYTGQKRRHPQREAKVELNAQAEKLH